ncbi:copper resistance protein CopC [Actinoplanes sp. CA-015351]|uniref:copper resistance CopC family protein n=1 Tax=Actinoplanes sp. CA-015351 TaxID=3239897 RepID=UPI003D95C2BD
MVAVLLPGAPAFAHNALTEATPAKNAELKKAPDGVTLKFLQKLNPDYTVISVSDADKQKVATSDPKIDGATGSVTFDELLANGVYTVAYQVVSTDGHTVKGSYKFTLDDPSYVAPTSAAPSLSPSAEPAAPPVSAAPAVIDAEPASDSGSSSALAWIAGIAVLVFAGLAGFLFVRRRKA